MNIDDSGTLFTRKQFLAAVGSGVFALVAGRVPGMIGSTSSTSFLRTIDRGDYGNSTYGGKNA